MSNITEVNSSTFRAEVLQASVPVLVDAYCPGCRPCQAAAPILEELADEMREQVKVVKFDADEELYLTAALRISAVPTFLVFKDGQEVARMVGLSTKEHLRVALLRIAA